MDFPAEWYDHAPASEMRAGSNILYSIINLNLYYYVTLQLQDPDGANDH